MERATGTVRVDVTTLQFGEPYDVGAGTEISSIDGVHVGIIGPDGQTLVNLRLNPALALEIATEMSKAAHKAALHASRANGDNPIGQIRAILGIGKDNK